MNPNNNLKSHRLSKFKNKDLTAKPEIQELQPEPEQLTKGKHISIYNTYQKTEPTAIQNPRSQSVRWQVAGEGR